MPSLSSVSSLSSTPSCRLSCAAASGHVMSSITTDSQRHLRRSSSSQQIQEDHTTKPSQLPTNLCLPQADKVFWKVGTVWTTEPQQNWVQPWPTEQQIRTLLHQIQFFPATSTATLQVEQLAQGSWNRVWIITAFTLPGQDEDSPNSQSQHASNGPPTGEEHRFVLRIALPVYPWFKTEAEVATMDYVRRHSTIPVPRVLLYDSSCANAVGYEWILMEFMPGVEFCKAAPDMSTPRKVRLARTLALWEHELARLQFPAIGSIYYTKSMRKAVEEASVSSSETGSGSVAWRLCDEDPTFCIGPAVIQEFLGDWRLSYSFNKGCFADEADLARSLVACRIFEAADVLQELRSHLNNYLILVEELEEHVAKLHKQQQGGGGDTDAGTRTAEHDDHDGNNAQEQITAAQDAIHRIKLRIADEASTRNLPTTHVDVEGPPRFPTANSQQMFASELAFPPPQKDLRYHRRDLAEAVVAGQLMRRVVDKIWPHKQQQQQQQQQQHPGPLVLGATTPLLHGTYLSSSQISPPHYMLSHWDISGRNVLVNAATGEPTALLDWEQVHTTSVLLKGRAWYPTLLTTDWVKAADDDHDQSVLRDQSAREMRQMKKAFLDTLRAKDSPLLESFAQLCSSVGVAAHKTSRVDDEEEEEEEDTVGREGAQGGEEEDCVSCCYSSSDDDEDVSTNEGQESGHHSKEDHAATASCWPNNRQDVAAIDSGADGSGECRPWSRARRRLMADVLDAAHEDKYFKYNSRRLLRRVHKYFPG